MSLKEHISAAINSDINAQISSDAATDISEEVNSNINLKKLLLQERGEIVKVNNITYSTVHDNISMYNNFVADNYYASKSWVLAKNYLTKEDIGDIDITNNIEELLNNKADKNHDHNDLYYTKDIIDINNNLLKEELTNKIPTKTSQLVNDSNYTTATQLNEVTELIPNTATVDNQLADKNFVNSSISTATAEFRGTVESLENLNNLTADINDYTFYKHKDENGNTVFDRYKFTDKWEYEYTLNNSSFTAEQWSAINSEITPSLVNTIKDNATVLNSLSKVAKTGSYIDLIDKPIIPTKTSELTNDSDYTTSEDIQTAIDNIPPASFADILEGVVGRTKVEWNALNAGEYGSNSTYNGATLPPVMLESTTAFWNSGSGKPLDISFHFANKEKMTSLQVKCPPYGGNSVTMTVYYAQEGDTELTLYKEIATISIIERKSYDFNEEGILADYWVVRFTASGWINLRLCKPGSAFTPGLYSEVFHEQLMDKMNGYQPVGNYALKSEIPTVPTKTSQLTNDSFYITSTDLNKITELIPNTATTENKLVDKNFVNSSILTATATFKGTFDNLTELQQTSADLNDYAYFKHTDDNHNIIYSRYKYSDGVWNFEYDLNTTGFTAEQWATINSGITANSIPTNYVDISSDQTINGKKIFSQKPVYEEHIVVGHNLPDEYQEVEYIQSGGTQYIDTGINPKIKPRVIVNMMLLNSADKDYWGNQAIDGSAYFANFASGILMYYRYGRTSSINTGVSAPFNEFHEWDVSDAIYLDKVKLYTTNNVYAYNANQSNIYLFKSARSYGNFRASYFILYDGDEKVREYYPCYRKSDNAIGLFDKVSNTFFPNLGSGVFIKGNDIISGEAIVERELVSNADIQANIIAYLQHIVNYNVNKTQVLKNVNGVFKWVDE